MANLTVTNLTFSGEVNLPEVSSEPGLPGPSAYQVWLNAGYQGTEEDFFEFLKGSPGEQGLSAYLLWLAQGHDGSIDDFFLYLKGEPGTSIPGDPGLSAYEIWLSLGNTGSSEDFLASLKGDPGAPGLPGGGTSGDSPSLSIFDFGAVGDGIADDSGAFRLALAHAALNGGKIIVPGKRYFIGSTITWTSTANTTRMWGLECQGATLLSGVPSGTDVMNLVSQHTVRYFSLSGGLTIKGNAGSRNGLRIFCTQGYFYNFSLDSLIIEGAGNDGLLLEGNVFECQITNSYFQDNGHNGATCAHSGGGVCSAVSFSGCYFNQNLNHGLEATNFDGQYGGAVDVRVYGGYCRDNRGFGIRYNNGLTQGGALVNVGFENNCKNLSPGDQNGAHIYSQGRIQLKSCTGYNQSGGATYLLRGYFNDLVLLDGCNQSAGGAMATTGLSRLVQVNGTPAGHVLMRGCNGGVAVQSGTTCTWAAENCTGVSPSGVLNVRGVVTG